ncbi:uncharacterized protein LOC120990686 [Bufo bufo]|uniref:uncharacterized protein LOC120990686 n=1 Tax=Bufo bufo TaxID=8384 RepID=UPI001ABDC869|nr:uncharacterized protein LOC120990686 [Bufo bufo]
MDRDKDKMAERVLNLTLEILCQLTGEDYTVVKKTSSERCQAPVSEGCRRTLSPITGPPPHSLIHEEINEQKILELIHKMIELLTGELPIRCQDVTVYFSMEEWEYVEGHQDLYKETMMPLTTPGSCNIKSSIHLTDPSRMDGDRDKMAEKILHLTLEILFQFTGEDYTVVKKTSSERCQAPVYEGCGRTLSPIMGPPPHSLIHEGINEQKILELIHKMIELLTGEVPIRCQDVAVYFSMEEWDYVEGHKDLYKEVTMKNHQPLKSPGSCNIKSSIHLTDPSRMDGDRDKMAEKILHLTLEILFQFTGEDYTVVKKTSSERCQAPVSEGWGRTLNPITGEKNLSTFLFFREAKRSIVGDPNFDTI